MSSKRSAIEQRKDKITAQINHLHIQLALKTRNDYSTDFRYELWRKKSHALINELLEELSILEEPGEYDELPAAIVADELGLSLSQITKLIKNGEIITSGRQAHERISRQELERLAKITTNEILQQLKEDVDEIFSQAVVQIRSGDLNSAERSYYRLKARQSSIGDYSLATEIALQLVKGMYEKAENNIKFILSNMPNSRHAVGTSLAEFLGGVCFKEPKARSTALHCLKMLIDQEANKIIRTGLDSDDLQSTAMYISTVVSRVLDESLPHLLSVNQQSEFYRLIKDGIFSAIFAEATSKTSWKSNAFIVSMRMKVPTYWEPPELLEELREQ